MTKKKERRKGRMKIGEILINSPMYLGEYRKPVWAYFENNYWTSSKTSCVLNINFRKEEQFLFRALYEELWNKSIDGLNIVGRNTKINITEDYNREYLKLFLNIDLNVIGLQKALQEISRRMMKSITRFKININKDKIEPLIEKGLVEML